MEDSKLIALELENHQATEAYFALKSHDCIDPLEISAYAKYLVTRDALRAAMWDATPAQRNMIHDIWDSRE